MRQYLPETFGLNNQFWIGKCESRADPLQMGRVRVRIYGHHTPDESLIPTELLPWAVPLMPSTNASLSGVGTTPVGIMEGTICFGVWMDGSDQQMPMVIGTLNALEGSGAPADIISTRENVINDQTLGAPGDFTPTGDGPSWLQVARGEIGVKEMKGGQHNPKILEYLKTVGIGSGDETPWCSAFAAWCLKNGGMSISGITGMAKSHARAPSLRRIDKLTYGCIVVLNRGSNPASGHVGFYVGSQGGRLQLLGGNQSNSVKTSGFPSSRVHALMWPAGAPLAEQAVTT